MYEVLRFNPHICESFYADEVLLVEGPTEEIVVRGILQKLNPIKDLFIVSCGTVNNIPFYQKVYRKFAIRNHVIFDTDGQEIGAPDEFNNPTFKSNIQYSVYNEHHSNCTNVPRIGGLLRYHDTTFETSHAHDNVSAELRYPNYPIANGKPFNANKYWLEILEPNLMGKSINTAPIISHITEILSFDWR
jgi:putative ATP-dependent endonuclease of the OLD family